MWATCGRLVGDMWAFSKHKFAVWATCRRHVGVFAISPTHSPTPRLGGLRTKQKCHCKRGVTVTTYNLTAYSLPLIVFLASIERLATGLRHQKFCRGEDFGHENGNGDVLRRVRGDLGTIRTSVLRRYSLR